MAPDEEDLAFEPQTLDLSPENWDDTALIRAYNKALQKVSQKHEQKHKSKTILKQDTNGVIDKQDGGDVLDSSAKAQTAKSVKHIRLQVKDLHELEKQDDQESVGGTSMHEGERRSQPKETVEPDNERRVLDEEWRKAYFPQNSAKDFEPVSTSNASHDTNQYSREGNQSPYAHAMYANHHQRHDPSWDDYHRYQDYYYAQHWQPYHYPPPHGYGQHPTRYTPPPPFEANFHSEEQNGYYERSTYVADDPSVSPRGKEKLSSSKTKPLEGKPVVWEQARTLARHSMRDMDENIVELLASWYYAGYQAGKSSKG